MRLRLSNALECCTLCVPYHARQLLTTFTAHFRLIPSLLRRGKSANQPQLPLTDASILLWLLCASCECYLALIAAAFLSFVPVCVRLALWSRWAVCVCVCVWASLCGCLQLFSKSSCFTLHLSPWGCARLALTLLVLQADRFSLRQH